jgi:hypothetical protein
MRESIYVSRTGRARRRFIQPDRHLAGTFAILEVAPWPPLWRGIISRLEIELAQLLLDTTSWPRACAFVNRLGNVVPRDWRGDVGELGMLLRPGLERSARIGASLYRPGPRANLRFSVIFEGSGVQPASISRQSRISSVAQDTNHSLIWQPALGMLNPPRSSLIFDGAPPVSMNSRNSGQKQSHESVAQR